jgi:prefoldin subunit 5
MRCQRLIDERQSQALELRAEQEKLDASNEELRTAKTQLSKLV